MAYLFLVNYPNNAIACVDGTVLYKKQFLSCDIFKKRSSTMKKTRPMFMDTGPFEKIEFTAFCGTISF